MEATPSGSAKLLRKVEHALDELASEGGASLPRVESIWFTTDGSRQSAHMSVSMTMAYYRVDLERANNEVVHHLGPRGGSPWHQAANGPGQVAQQIEIALNRINQNADDDAPKVVRQWMHTKPGQEVAHLLVEDDGSIYQVNIGSTHDQYAGHGGPGGRDK